MVKSFKTFVCSFWVKSAEARVQVVAFFVRNNDIF